MEIVNIRYLSALLAALVMATPVGASAQLTAPPCTAYERWVSPMPARPPASYRSGTAEAVKTWTIEKSKIFDQIFGDTSTTQTFGAAFNDWSDADLKAVRNGLIACRMEAGKANRQDEVFRMAVIGEHLNARRRGAPPSIPFTPAGTPGECISIHQWVSAVASQKDLEAMAKTQSFRLDVYTIRARERDELLTDAATRAAFGKALSQWGQYDFQNNRDRLDRCRMLRGDPNMSHRVEIGRGFIMNHWSQATTRN